MNKQELRSLSKVLRKSLVVTEMKRDENVHPDAPFQGKMFFDMGVHISPVKVATFVGEKVREITRAPPRRGMKMRCNARVVPMRHRVSGRKFVRIEVGFDWRYVASTPRRT